jgi:YggT family protein
VSLAIQFVLYYVLFFFWLLLIGRIVVELVRSFARQWIGGVGLDLSIMVLLLVVFILMNVAQPTPL